MDAIISGSRMKNPYMQLVKDIRRTPVAASTTPEYRELIHKRHLIEQQLPVNALIYFRQSAMREFTLEEAGEKATKANATKSPVKPASSIPSATSGANTQPIPSSNSGSFYGYFKRGFRAKEPIIPPAPAEKILSVDVDISIDDINDTFEKHIESEVSFLASLKLEGLLLGVKLTDESNAPIAMFELQLSSSCEMRAMSTLLTLAVDNLVIRDLYSSNPPFPNIVQGVSPSKPVSFSLNATLLKSSTLLRLNADTMQICWTETCIMGLMKYFAESHVNSTDVGLLYPVITFMKRYKYDLSLTNDVDIKVEIDAPIFVFPVTSTLDTKALQSFVVFDMGHLSLDLTTAIKSSQFKCITKLSNVQSGISNSALSVLDTKGEKSQLIQPFDISVSVHDDTFPLFNDLYIDVKFDHLFMQVDILRLECLLRTYMTISDCCFKVDDVPVSHTSTPKVLVAPQSSGSNVVGETVPAYVVNVLVPSYTIDMLYDVPNNLRLCIGCESLICTASNIDVTVTLKAISIQDLCGPTKLMSLIEGFNHDDLVLISFKYSIFANSISVQVADVEITTTDGIFSRVTPFLVATNQLLTRMTSSASTPSTEVSSTNVAVNRMPSATLNSISSDSLNVTGPTLLSISLSLHRISLILYSSHPPPSYLSDKLFSFSIIGLTIDSTKDVSVVLDSVIVLDEREVSARNAIRTLFISNVARQQARAVELLMTTGFDGDTKVDIKLHGLDLFVNLAAYVTLVNAVTAVTLAAYKLLEDLNVSGDVEASMKTALSSASAQVQQQSSIEVSLILPRLLLVEDATLATSTALCFTCNVNLTYSRLVSTKVEGISKAVEKYGASIEEIESFILPDIGGDRILQVVYPFDILVTCKCSYNGDVCASIEIDLAVHKVIAQVTMKDMTQIIRIFNQCTTMSISSAASTSIMPTPDDLISIPAVKPVEDISIPAVKPVEDASDIMYRLQAPELSFTLEILNDCQEHVTPMLKVTIMLANALFSGPLESIHGGLELTGTIDYFNTKLNDWEPMLEELSAAVRYNSERDEMSLSTCNLELENVQLNVSSLMLKSLGEAMNSVQLHKTTVLRRGQKLHFENKLGEPVELFDATMSADASMTLFSAPDEGLVEIPLIARDSGRPTHPGFLNIALAGEHRNNARIKHVAISSATSLRCYHIVEKTLSTKVKRLEDVVVVDELYENQRFSVQDCAWTTPFILNDPAPWTEVHMGFERGDLRTFQLPGREWKWVSAWEVVLHEKGDTDEQGFEYSINFINFGDTCRGKHPLDSVRRRKWCRTRKLVDCQGSLFRDVYVFTSLTFDSTGQQVFRIESGFKVVNRTSLNMVCHAIGTANEEGIKGKLEEGGSLHLPLSHGSLSSLSFCLDGMAWSRSYSLDELVVGHMDVELKCAIEMKSKYFRISLLTTGLHIQVVCSPLYSLINNIPFDLKCRIADEPECSLRAGESLNLYSYNHDHPCVAEFALGSLSWSEKIAIGNIFSRVRIGNKSGMAVTLMATPQVGPRGTVELLLRSRAVVVNRCDMNLHIRQRESAVGEWQMSGVSSTLPYSRVHGDSPVETSMAHLGCWATGVGGVRLLQLDTDNFQVGVLPSWSETLILSILEGTKATFEVACPEVKWQLAYAVSSLPAPFEDTSLVTIMPKFRLLNSVNEEVSLRLTNATTTDVFELLPDTLRSWSPTVSSKLTEGKWLITSL
jgi:hypothetical protein